MPLTLSRNLAMLATLGLSLSACSSGNNSPGATHPVSNTGKFAVPSKMTPTYVQEVLNALDVAQLPATVSAYRTGHLTAKGLDIMHSIYTGPAYRVEVAALSKPAKGARKEVRSHPQPPKTTVTSLVSSAPNCIFTKVTRNQSPEFRISRPFSGYIALIPSTSARNPAYNPTPWMIASESLTGVPNPCG